MVGLLAVIGGYRLTLVDSGHFYWADERCYLPVYDLLTGLQQGRLGPAIHALFHADGPVPPARPGFIGVSLLPAIVQRIWNDWFLVAPDSLASFDVVCVFNVATSLGLSWIAFALVQSWTGSMPWGLLAALVSSLSSTGNVWIRHLVPYQYSALFLLGGLLLITRCSATQERSRGSDIIAGVLTGLGFACYPGHYLIVVLNAVLVFALAGRRFRSLVEFGVAAAGVLLLFEGLAQTVRRSYFGDLCRLSETVSMGDANEGFLFLWRYLREVEGAAGIAILILFLIGAIVALRYPSRFPRAATLTMLVAIGCYALHAVLGLITGRTVFYGRLLLPFTPILAGGAVMAIVQLRSRRLRTVSTILLLAAVLFSFGRFAMAYANVAYPADFLQETMAKIGRGIHDRADSLWGRFDGTTRDTAESIDDDLILVADPRPEGSSAYAFLSSHADATQSARRFVAVNFRFIWYIPETQNAFAPSEEYQLIAEAPHPETLAPFWFEGRKPWERRRLEERQYTLRVYERKFTPKPDDLTKASRGR